jgi:folate-binding protein YgfZ
METALRAGLEAGGAVFGEVAGRVVVRHYGDSAAEYRAVREAVGIALRDDLTLLRMWGRDPVRMLNGLLTNDVASAGAERGVYGALLTPKGRAVAELRAFRGQNPDGTELLIALPNEAAAGTREHLKKYVPPLFARWEDVSERRGALGVYGPAAAGLIARVVGCEVPGTEEERTAHGHFDGEPVLVARTRDAGLEDGYDLFAAATVLPALRAALLEDGTARPVGFGALETLRIEAGRPRYGAELSEETIPTEAYEETGLLPRAISFTKGCYTGQEVIIRIAHRGHVNRHLRGLLLGDRPVPAARTPLFHPDTGKEIGRTTSAAVSPLMAQTVALGFVRREVAPGAAVRLAAPDGDTVPVVKLPFGSVES